ncbi:insulinase family protein [Streptomyces sp. NPDC006385]|uniref:M16 family metallopeptidase n=1 Tax=Streptomyces sp. NPDC006385 TaxID=3156761 RepID=UPI0033BC9238
MRTTTGVRMPHLATHQGAGGLTITASVLPTVPMVQAHLAVPLRLRDRSDLAACDVLTACWPDLPACARFEQRGGIVHVRRNRQWMYFSLVCAADQLPLLAHTLAAAVHAEYPEDLVRPAAAKAAQQAGLAVAQPAVEATRRLWEAVYGHLPPLADPVPDPGEVLTVSARQVTAAHAQSVDPGPSHLVVVGDLDVDRLFARLDAALGSWHGPADPAPQLPSLRPLSDRSVHRHARPGWQQTLIRLAAPSSSRQDIDALPAALAAALILGGNFSSKVMTVLREQLGLAYRATAQITGIWDSDMLVIEADVAPATVDQAMSQLGKLLEEFATTGPTERELAAAVGYSHGAYNLALGSQSSRASCLLSYLTNGQPLSRISEIPARTAELTCRDVRQAAALFHPRNMSGVICEGTAPSTDDEAGSVPSITPR